MVGNMKGKSLMHKMLVQFIVCVTALLLLATPLFYLLTKNFYAEDMYDLMEAIRQGRTLPSIDMEQDIMQGIMLQFVLIISVMGAAIVLTIRFISKRLWRPFDHTLAAIEGFKLEDGTLPAFETSDIKEFARLDTVLERLIRNSLHSYRLQKEFTENASHELQTPLAIFQSKLDMLLQLPDITEEQAAIIQDLYQMNARLSRLNRNLLLLAKMENRQFKRTESVDVVAVIEQLRTYLESMAQGLHLTITPIEEGLRVMANRSLFESLVNNLTVNAIRHNRPGGWIDISISREGIRFANTSDEPELDREKIFSRFHQTTVAKGGNGLGLAIVKAVCDYHQWRIEYTYQAEGIHQFEVKF